MKISDILKSKGIYSKEIKARLSNGNIKLNDETIKEDIDLDINDVEDVGEFLFKLVSNKNYVEQLKFFGLENIINSNINNDLTNFLNNFFILRFSKKDLLILKKNK